MLIYSLTERSGSKGIVNPKSARMSGLLGLACLGPVRVPAETSSLASRREIVSWRRHAR
jgi:hypothetical protein